MVNVILKYFYSQIFFCNICNIHSNFFCKFLYSKIYFLCKKYGKFHHHYILLEINVVYISLYLNWKSYSFFIILNILLLKYWVCTYFIMPPYNKFVKKSPQT